MMTPPARLCLVVQIAAVVVVALTDPSGATDLSLEEFQQWDKLHDMFLVSWNANSSYIVFKLEVQTRGYVGFGVSRHGGMQDTDMLVCGADRVGDPYLCTDRYSVNDTTPVKDDSQDVHVFAVDVVDDTRVVRFGRQLSTGDAHDVDITRGMVKVAFAFGIDEVISYHGDKRGTSEIVLLQPPPPPPDSPESVVPPGTRITVELLTNNFTIPSDRDTFYSCTMFKLPELVEKHHLIKVEAVLADVSKSYVQHMMLYSCTGDIEGAHSQQSQCYQANAPLAFGHCQGIVAAWAIGGEPFEYPEDVGYSLGMKDDPKYVLLQIHYNNPELDKGVVDNSGFRLFCTDKLRRYDAGILEVGTDPSPYHMIPPNVSSFITYGLCSTEVLRKDPVSSVRVFDVLLHAHVAGRQIHVRQFRDGKEIGYLARDDVYDVNSHKYIHFPQSVEVMAGDMLVVECTYGTKGRSDITTGGFEMRQEMCLAYLHHYPRVGLARCRSTVHVPTLARDLLGCEVTASDKYRYVVSAPKKYEGRALESVMAEYEWSEERVKEYSRLLQSADYDVRQYLLTTDTWLYETARLPATGSVGRVGRLDPWLWCGWEIIATTAVAILLHL